MYILTQYVCYAMAPDRQEIVKLCEEKSSKLFWTKMRQIFLEYSKILRVLRLIAVSTSFPVYTVPQMLSSYWSNKGLFGCGLVGRVIKAVTCMPIGVVGTGRQAD